MDEMNISQCLDYIQEYIDNNSEDGKQKTIKANQNDFNTPCADKELEGLASRLNGLLGSDFSNSIKIQRL